MVDSNKIFFRFKRNKLDSSWVMSQVQDADCGATVCFLGTVRQSSFSSRAVLALEYQAYEEMVSVEFKRIVERVAPGIKVALEHMLGKVSVGEATIALAVSTPHRKEAFAKGEVIMHEIKSHLPIWKKEIYSDGESWLGGNVTCSIS